MLNIILLLILPLSLCAMEMETTKIDEKGVQFDKSYLCSLPSDIQKEIVRYCLVNDLVLKTQIRENRFTIKNNCIYRLKTKEDQENELVYSLENNNKLKKLLGWNFKKKTLAVVTSYRPFGWDDQYCKYELSVIEKKRIINSFSINNNICQFWATVRADGNGVISIEKNTESVNMVARQELPKALKIASIPVVHSVDDLVTIEYSDDINELALLKKDRGVQFMNLDECILNSKKDPLVSYFKNKGVCKSLKQ